MARLKVPSSEISAVATALYKFQNFKPSVILGRVKSDYYKDGSIIRLHGVVRKYLATKIKSEEAVPSLFYDALDECIRTHIQPLRPTKDEKAQPYIQRPRKSSNVENISSKPTPISDIQKDYKKYSTHLVAKPTDNTAEVINKWCSKHKKSAVKVGDVIRLFESDDILKGYTLAMQELGQTFETINIIVL